MLVLVGLGPCGWILVPFSNKWWIDHQLYLHSLWTLLVLDNFRKKSRGEVTSFSHEDLIDYHKSGHFVKPIIAMSKLRESSHCHSKVGGEVQSRSSHPLLSSHLRTQQQFAWQPLMSRHEMLEGRGFSTLLLDLFSLCSDREWRPSISW